MSIRIKNKHSLKKKEIKDFLNEINNILSIDIDLNNLRFETGFYDDVKIIFVDDDPCFIVIDNRIFFTLHGIIRFKPKDKFVIVDMGAIEYITSGADLMAPGIVDADINIKVDDFVWISDEKYRKPLAIGVAIMDGEHMIHEKKGKSVKIVHYVGDKYWNIK